MNIFLVGLSVIDNIIIAIESIAYMHNGGGKVGANEPRPPHWVASNTKRCG